MEKKNSQNDVPPTPESAVKVQVQESDPANLPLDQAAHPSDRKAEAAVPDGKSDSPSPDPAVLPEVLSDSSAGQPQPTAPAAHNAALCSSLDISNLPQLRSILASHFLPGQEAFRTEDLPQVTETVSSLLGRGLSPAIQHILARVSTPAISLQDYLRLLKEWMCIVDPQTENVNPVREKELITKISRDIPLLPPANPLEEENNDQENERLQEEKNPSVELFKTEFMGHFGKIK